MKEETQKQFRVLVYSEEYGGETFGPYESSGDAYGALSKVAASAAKLNDGVLRKFEVLPDYRREVMTLDPACDKAVRKCKDSSGCSSLAMEGSRYCRDHNGLVEEKT